MEHAVFVASLPLETRTRLTRRTNASGLRHLALHLGLIGLTGGLIAWGGPLWPALIPLQGVLIVFLFTLEHECTHRTPFRSAALNEWMGRMAGLLLVLPFEWFRCFHLAHHRFTNLPGLDPELASPKPATWRDWLWHVSGVPYWFGQGRLVWRLALGCERADYLPAGALPRMTREARILLGIYGLAALSLLASPLLLWVWLVPVLVAQPVLRLYLLAEHGDCPAVANLFENTRTTFTSGLVRFLAWNMPYHTEHHVMPSVPFHALPALHRLMRDRLGVTETGYLAFTRAYLARRRRRSGSAEAPGG